MQNYQACKELNRKFSGLQIRVHNFNSFVIYQPKNVVGTQKNCLQAFS